MDEKDDSLSLDHSIRTYISHNKGGRWELIRAPEKDSDGKTIKCFIEDGCSLHLNIYSSDGIYPPPYSQESSVGIIMGVGNVGTSLSKNHPD